VNGTLSSNLTLNIQGGVIGGTGTVAANVTNGGTTVPGGVVNTGIFTITGNDTQGNISAVNIRIAGRTAGTQFDQFNISGAISLNGTLAITAVGGFRPSTGDTFTVMDFGSSSGAFASITGLDFGSGCSLQPNLNPTNLTLQAISTGPVAVNVSPGTPSVPPLGAQQFTQTTTGDCNLAVTWSLREGAAGGTVTNTGLYTAPANPGVFHVVATSVADPTKTGVATVTVLKKRRGQLISQ
jgi:chitinase